MRTFLRIALAVVAALLLFFGYTLVSTGYFRSIEPEFDGRVLDSVALAGAEDITIARADSFAIVSATDRRGFPAPPQEPGGLYLIDLGTRDFAPVPLTTAFTRPFAPHGISLFKTEGGYRLMAINHAGGRHSIEVFSVQDRKLRHLRTLTHPSMVSPNDLVMVGEDRFYFTNDHGFAGGVGKTVEDFAGLPLSTVVYYDGEDYREVAGGIAYANGIAYDPRRELLYVAALRRFSVKVYSVGKDGSLSHIEDIPCGTGVDNIELDEAGNLWIGAHPNLLRFIAYAKGKRDIAPSEVIRVEYRKPGDFTVERLYLEDGRGMSGSSVAVPWGNLLLVGNVMDEKFLVLERNLPASPR
ncbi:arylesterase/paraoxonase [Lewinella marina]|uniref:Arylesterase n=1 Tax=Neolewinella marina TaxID=438751 RepID=A0A2G0CKI7_9BACT|nr:SMP-30/gluconolactonase/LRE family protein [Neolewinella marina]NJB84343.1 arylesterase/paraoxonase [Neolewinella marina]PHL00458.1 hypothetical protein CGL56_05345 [Neolewinella marina]